MGQRIKIAIVDSDKGSRDGLARLLRLEDDYRVVAVADTVEDGLKKILEQEPDIVLTEINLDGLDGFCLTELVRNRLPATQVVIVSIQDDAHYMLQAFRSGAFDILAKPVTAAELSYCLERAYREALHMKEKIAADQRNRELREILGKEVEVFVSYSRADWDHFAEPLVTHLRRHGFKVWVDQHLLRGGHDWLDEINGALDMSDFMVLCLSPDSIRSKYVKLEYRTFFQADKPIIPVMCRPVDRLPAELQIIQYQPYDLQALVTVLEEIINEQHQAGETS